MITFYARLYLAALAVILLCIVTLGSALLTGFARTLLESRVAYIVFLGAVATLLVCHRRLSRRPRRPAMPIVAAASTAVSSTQE